MSALAPAAAAIAATLICFAAMAATQSHITSIWTVLRQRRSRLALPPARFGSVDIAFILAAVVWKSVLGFLGRVPRLVQSSNLGEDEFDLPAVQISAPVEISDGYIQQYRAAEAVIQDHSQHGSLAEQGRKEQQHDLNPLPLLIVALTNPLMMLVIANYNSPILPLGAVNTRNKFEYFATDMATLRGKHLLAMASFGGPQGTGRRTRRGVEFDVVIEVTSHSSTNQQQGVGQTAAAAAANSGIKAAGSGQLVLRQRITIMQTLPKAKSVSVPKSAVAPTSSIDAHSAFSTDLIRVPQHAPGRWARLCKDYNPIHVSAVAARLFGFPGRMAHGNHVVCKVLATICQDESFRERKLGSVEVAFKRPMVLPIDLNLSYQTAKDGRVVFELTRGEKVHVDGSIQFV